MESPNKHHNIMVVVSMSGEVFKAKKEFSLACFGSFLCTIQKLRGFQGCFLTIEKRSHVTFQERSTIENVRSKRERSRAGLIVKTSSNENDDQLYLSDACAKFCEK